MTLKGESEEAAAEEAAAEEAAAEEAAAEEAAVAARLKRYCLRDEVVSPLVPERLNGGQWGSAIDWPEGLRAGVIEPKRGYRYRPENLALALLLHRCSATPARVLDLGAGSGSLTLIARYLLSPERTLALELQEAQANRLGRTLQAHQLENTEVLCGDLRSSSTVQELRSKLGGDADLILCNPPWFPANWGRASANASTRQSTHAEFGDASHFLSTAEELLEPDGRLWVLFDAQRLADLVAAISGTSLLLCRMEWLSDQRPGKDGQPYRVWCELQVARGAPVRRLL